MTFRKSGTGGFSSHGEDAFFWVRLGLKLGNIPDRARDWSDRWEMLGQSGAERRRILLLEKKGIQQVYLPDKGFTMGEIG